MTELRIADVMTTDLVKCAPGTTLNRAAQLMRDHAIGNVLVADGDQLLGIVTDRDLVVRCMADGSGADGSIDAAMTPGVATVSPNDSIDDAASLMRDRALRRAPVVDGGRLVGIVSLGDLAVTEAPESALGQISSAQPNN